MSFISPLLSTVPPRHETSPQMQSEVLPLVQERLLTLMMLTDRTITAEAVQANSPQSNSEHFINNNPMARVVSITRDSNALGELAGLEQTHSNAAAAAVEDFSNGDLDLGQALSSETHSKYIDEITKHSVEQSQISTTFAQLTNSTSKNLTEADQSILEARAKIAELQGRTTINPAQHIIDATNHISDEQFSLVA